VKNFIMLCGQIPINGIDIKPLCTEDCETETPYTDMQEFRGYMLHLTTIKWHLPEHTNVLKNIIVAWPENMKEPLYFNVVPWLRHK
jgi:hypothetical protein